jgi:hypothetical protein
MWPWIALGVGGALVLVGTGLYRPGFAEQRVKECRLLTAFDIKAMTGERVRPVLIGPGRCANYETMDGMPYLAISTMASEAEYRATVDAIRPGAYADVERLDTIGDEALLFKGEGKDRPGMLIARRRRTGVLLFARSARISDRRLREFAAKALAVS